MPCAATIRRRGTGDAARGKLTVKNISTFWLVGAGLSAAFVLYGAYLHAFFRWSTSLSGMRAVAKLAMHETARQITVSDAAG
jgi:hypothetical protein